MTSAPYRPSYLAADDVIAAYTSCFLGVLMMPEAVKAGWNGEKSYKETRGAWNGKFYLASMPLAVYESSYWVANGAGKIRDLVLRH